MVSFSAGQEVARALLEGPQRHTCLAGGTRSGKTFLIVRSIVERAIKAPGSHHVILRFHANAARASIALDTLPSVMALCFPDVAMKEARQDGFFKLANGSRIAIGGLDDKDRVEKILGLEYATVFLNEASQIPYTSALVAFTRLAQVIRNLPQRAYVDLNPTNTMHWTNTLFGDKRVPVSRQPLSDPDQYARAFINPRDNAANLSPEYLESLAHLPERQRKRFYEGVYVEAVDDALWTFEIIDRYRCGPEDIFVDKRMSVVVAVDPSGAAGRDDLGADEIGIVVAAKHEDGGYYVLADRSCREAPAVWSRRAVAAFHEFQASLCEVALIVQNGVLRSISPPRSERLTKRRSGLSSVTEMPFKPKHRHTMHDLRHSFATNQFHFRKQAGDPDPWFYIIEQLGHRHVGTTKETYIHYITQFNGLLLNGTPTNRKAQA